MEELILENISQELLECVLLEDENTAIQYFKNLVQKTKLSIKSYVSVLKKFAILKIKSISDVINKTKNVQMKEILTKAQSHVNKMYTDIKSKNFKNKKDVQTYTYKQLHSFVTDIVSNIHFTIVKLFTTILMPLFIFVYFITTTHMIPILLTLITIIFFISAIILYFNLGLQFLKFIKEHKSITQALKEIYKYNFDPQNNVDQEDEVFVFTVYYCTFFTFVALVFNILLLSLPGTLFPIICIGSQLAYVLSAILTTSKTLDLK